jgi:hypothetical protein
MAEKNVQKDKTTGCCDYIFDTDNWTNKDICYLLDLFIIVSSEFYFGMMPKKNVQKDKQRSTKLTHKTKDQKHEPH